MESARIRARLERQYVLLQAPADLGGRGVSPFGERLASIEPSTDVVVDMSDVECCTDDAWNLLSRATRRLSDADGSLTLSRLRPDLRAALRTSPYAGELKVRRRDR